MPAETAAAPGVAGANQSSQNGADVPSQGQPAGTTQEKQQPLREPIGDRAAELEMLNLLDVPAEVLDRVRQSAEKDAEEQGKKQEIEHEHDHEQEHEGERERADDATWPDSARTRVGKLTAKREELKTQLSDRDTEIARLRAIVEQPGQQAPQQQAAAKAPAAHDGNPYAAATNEAEIAESVRVAREVRDWALMNLEGVDEVPLSADANGEVKTKDFSALEVRKMLVDANRALEIHLPGRMQQLQQERMQENQRQQAEAIRPRWEEIGVEDHPDLANPESVLSKHVGQLLEAYPFLKGAPDGRVVAADIVAASLKRAERLADAGLIVAPAGRPRGNGAADTAATTIDPKLQPFLAPKPLRAPAVPSSAHGAPPPASTAADETKAREDYLNSGRSEEDHEAFVNRLSEIQTRNGSNGVTPARV